jgi:hypothetical protein
MTKNLSAIICTGILLLFLSQTAHACFCSVVDAKTAFSSSHAVFIGKVSKITTAKEASVGYSMQMMPGKLKLGENGKWEKSFDKIQNVTLEIIEPLKGVTEKTFVLSTAAYNGGGSCGVPFTIGEAFLVFARKTQPMLTKDEAAQPKDNWTLDMRLKAEADKFNGQLPLYATDICARTERLRFMKQELSEIRSFIKDGGWKEPDIFSPFMPPLP